MSDFEELKLTVNLTDNASAGLANIRTQLTGLTQTAGQVSTSLTSVATSATQVGKAAGEAAPKVASQEKQLKELARSAEETTRGMLQMALAARRGTEAFPELALAFRETTQGLKGVNAGMTDLAPAAATMVRSLAMVAVGVTAVGAAVVAYGVSVFKFSQEMYQLGQTARALGLTFGALKSITEQGEKFGVSADVVIRGLQGIQQAQTNLSENNSPLRQRLQGMGVDPNFLTNLQRENDPAKFQNMVRERAKMIEQARRAEGRTAMASRGEANKFVQEFGLDPSIMDRPALRPKTKEEEEAFERIDKQSRAIAEQWAEISETISNIKTDFLAWGLPDVLVVVKGIRSAFDGIGDQVKQIKELFATIDSWTPQWLKNVFRGMANGPGHADDAFTNALKGIGNGPNGAPVAPGATPPPQTWRSPNRNPRSGYHPTSFTGDGGDEMGSSNGGRAQAIIKGGVFDALVAFNGYLQTGRTAGGGGGFSNASFGGSGGAAAGGGFGGGASSFGSSAFPNLGGANAAGGAGLPSGLGGGGGGGGLSGGAGLPHGSHVGPGAGDGAGESPAGVPGGGGDTSKVGNAYLASQRARLKKELDDNPELKRRFAAIVQTENPGAGTAVAESAMNRAAMTGRSMSSILQGGPKSFYGPARRGQIEPTMRNMSSKDLAARYRQIDEALAGSNQVRGNTDQGSAGDPNYLKGGTGVNINRERFNDWGGYKGVENSRRWREAQQAQVNRSADEATAAANADAGQKRLYVSPDRSAMNAPLDRGALSRPTEINSTGKLDVNVSAPAGTKVAYHGQNLLKNTSMQRQTQMMPTQGGPSVSDTASSYMRGGN